MKKNKFLPVLSMPKGFTLIELIVVMAIIAVLSTIGIISFRASQVKARDVRRKNDLEQISRALEMYHNDYGSYPNSVDGKISIGLVTYNWGDEFTDAHVDESGNPLGTVYMKELPHDSITKPYCYWSDGSSYKIYAQLENIGDSQCLDLDCASTRLCNNSTYNFGVSSSNIEP